MENIKIFNLVRDKLHQHGVKIINESNNEKCNDNFFILDGALISVNEEKKYFCISFHLSTISEHAVYLALILKEIKNIRMHVADSFIFDDNGEYIDGEEAIKFYEKKVSKQITDKFIQEQQEKFILATSNGFKC